MTGRPSLTYIGSDVAPIRRCGDGRVMVVFLDRAGQPTTHTAEAWPHELRGVGWHIAEIKRFVSCLPGEAREPEPRPVLHAHHAIAHED